MLYGLNAVNSDLLNIKIKNSQIIFDFKNNIKEGLSSDNRKKIAVLLNCTNDLKEKDLIIVKSGDRYFICKVLNSAKDDEKSIKIDVELHELADCPKDLRNVFKDILFDKIHNETMQSEIERIFSMFKSKDEQSLQIEFIKNNRALVEIKKTDRINRKILKDLKNNRGELVIELNPPKMEEESKNLPIIYEEEKEEMEEAYLELLKNQIEFCIQIQKLATDQLIKTQQIFNSKFFKRK
ncbi:hypothetical protein ING2D1G_1330 [Peptoniphilus sp. ING2-D1G]|nr:hypothetical protein ING2D1G_1330 [Peptoniphilus sp. ING2-D1G]